MNETRQGSMTGTVVAAMLAGFVFGAGLAGLGGYVVIQRESRKMKGWNLVPVVVAAQDIAAGATITFDLISQRVIPEQFVTSSVVKPDSASYIVNQRTLVPMQAGDPLYWSSFETSKASECRTLTALAKGSGKEQELQAKLDAVARELNLSADAGK